MSTTLEQPKIIRIESVHGSAEKVRFEPNFGPSDMHAIKAIALIMIGIFSAALVMYGTITLLAFLGS